MKLTKLYIHNYKSFYDTTIELDKLNIVVGENNSGKSNLIDVLEFIDIAMSKDIERAIDDKGGYDKIKNYSAVGEEKVVIRAILKVDNLNTLLSMFFNEEVEIIVSLSFTKTYSYLSFFVCSKKANIKFIKSTLIKNSKIKEKFIIYPNTWVKTDIALIEEICSLIPLYMNFSTYYFNAQKIRTLSNQDSKYTKLLKDGSNLGKVLYEIKEKDKNRFEAISNSLITTVNEIDGIEVYKVAGNYIIAFKERGEEPIPVHMVSDGTINFLTTMTALNQESDSSLLVFEEPERHLHLKVMDYLLQNFRASDKQIIITTHSTELLNYANLEEIVFIYRDSDGDTQSIRAINIPNLEGKMERLAYERPMSLEEMVSCGMVGNFE